MVKFIKRLLIAAVCYGVAYLFLTSIPLFQGFNLTLNGWAWAVFIPVVIGMAFVHGFGTGVLKGIVEHTDIETNSVINKFVDEIFDWLSYAVAFVITMAVMPDSASVTSVPVMFTVAAFVGCVAATYDIVCDRLVK